MRRCGRSGIVFGSAYKVLAVPLAMGAAFSGGEAPAQNAGQASVSGNEEMGVIVVTARKREENLYDIPESIDAFSSQELELKGISSVDDLGRQTPGLVLNRRLDGQPNVLIRGVGSFGNVKGVGFYVDDVQNFTDQTMRLEDLDRIEVLKGPQGTLYGGSNIGGAIRYISKRPTFDFGGAASVEAGSDEFRNAYAALNVPLQSDKAALRVSGSYTHDDGFIANGNIGGSNSKYNEYAVRAQFLVQPVDDFSMLLTARYRKRTGSAFSYEMETSNIKPGYVAMSGYHPNSKQETWGITANMNYNLGGVELTSISSYTEQAQSVRWDLDYTPSDDINAFTMGCVYPAIVYSQELRLTSDPSDKFDWILGIYGSRAQNVFNGPMPTYVTLPAFFGNFPILGNDSKAHLTMLAAFGTANLYLQNFTLGMGLRVQRSKHRAKVSTVGIFTVFDPALVIDNNDTTLLPKLSLSYKLGGGTMLYASAAKGYEAGRATVTAAPVVNYRPEQLWAYEIGIKRDSGRFRFDAAAFYLDYSDRQFETRSFDPLVGGQIERIDNIGDSTAYGFEVGATLNATDNLTLEGGASYIHARWDKNAIFGVDDTSTPNTADVSNIALDGQEVPNTPEWQINLGAAQAIPFSNGTRLMLHADGQYTSRIRWAVSPLTQTNYTPSYWVANARVSYGPESGGWEIAARVENIFDKGYYTEFYPNFFALGQHLGSPGAPRRVFVSLSAKF